MCQNNNQSIVNSFLTQLKTKHTITSEQSTKKQRYINLKLIKAGYPI